MTKTKVKKLRWKKRRNQKMQKIPRIKDLLQEDYWFDNQMHNGTHHLMVIVFNVQ